MANNSKKNNSSQEFVEILQNLIDAESTLSSCCKHLFLLMRDGRIRSEFKKFSDIADDNIKILTDYLQNEGCENFVLEQKCQYCRINPESFSLEGATKLSLEIIEAGLKLYKKLLKLNNEAESKNLFKSLIKEKNNQKNFLKKESEVIEFGKEGRNVMDFHCLAAIASKLGK